MTQPIRPTDKVYWVVVADESRATVYTRETKRAPLNELFSLQNEVARKKTAELISDRGGRSFDSHGQGRHTMVKEKADLRKNAAAAFAKQIAERAAKALHSGACRGVALVAAPRFLGLLRDAISTAAHTEPYATVDKEVVGHDTSTIEKLLAAK